MKAKNYLGLGLSLSMGLMLMAGCSMSTKTQEAQADPSTQKESEVQVPQTEKKTEGTDTAEKIAATYAKDEVKTVEEAKKETEPPEKPDPEEKTESRTDSLEQYVGTWVLDGEKTNENASEDIFVTFGSGLRSSGAEVTIKKDGNKYKMKGFVGVGLSMEGEIKAGKDKNQLIFEGEKTVESAEKTSFEMKIQKDGSKTYLVITEYDVDLYFEAK